MEARLTVETETYVTMIIAAVTLGVLYMMVSNGAA